MREILFKAKRIDNGEWVEGCYVRDISRENTSLSKFAHRIQPLFPQAYAHPIDPNTICQYTGLTDKNSNKIWENDVLREIEEDMTMAVRWDDDRLGFVLDEYGMTGCLMEYGFDETAGRFDVVDTYGFNDFYTTKSFEVIGNIFDNAELIGGVANE